MERVKLPAVSTRSRKHHEVGDELSDTTVLKKPRQCQKVAVVDERMARLESKVGQLEKAVDNAVTELTERVKTLTDVIQSRVPSETIDQESLVKAVVAKLVNTTTTAGGPGFILTVDDEIKIKQ